MSHTENAHALATILRMRAEVLMRGDAKAQLYACDLHADADEIDPHRDVEEIEQRAQ